MNPFSQALSDEPEFSDSPITPEPGVSLRRDDDSPADEGTPLLVVHVLYEDAETGLRARRALERLANHLKLEADFHIQMSRVDLLREPDLREQAAREAETADVLLFSAHGQLGFPPMVHSWIERWLVLQPREPRALVVLLDAGAEDSARTNQTLAMLKAAAQGARVDVFPHFGEALDPEWELSAEDIQYRAETKTALLDEALHRMEKASHRFWGINE